MTDTSMTHENAGKNGSVLRRSGLAGAAIAVALLAIGGGVALFTDSAEVEQEIAVGTVSIDLSGTGSFGAPVTGLGAGDEEVRFLTVENASSMDLGDLTLDIAYEGDEEEDVLGGELGFNVTVCSYDDLGETPDRTDCAANVGEVVVGTSSGPGSYTFAGLGSSVEGVSLDELLDDFNDDVDLAVRVIVQLDEDAGDEVQGQGGELTYIFEATQRAPVTVG